jgi:hypothetical protein
MSARQAVSDRQIPYLLSDADYQALYSDFIQPAYINESWTPFGRPVAYFLGAQPGSGKTKLRVGLQTSAEVIINTDDLRWIHPHYVPLLDDPATNEMAGYW